MPFSWLSSGVLNGALSSAISPIDALPCSPRNRWAMVTLILGIITSTSAWEYDDGAGPQSLIVGPIRDFATSIYTFLSMTQAAFARLCIIFALTTFCYCMCSIWRQTSRFPAWAMPSVDSSAVGFHPDIVSRDINILSPSAHRPLDAVPERDTSLGG